MSDFFVVETATRIAGLAVRAEHGFRFYASDHAFARLEGRRYARIEDLHIDISRITGDRPTEIQGRRRGTVGGASRRN